MTEMLLYLVLHLGGLAPAPELDDQLRPVSLFGRTVHESCNRAAFYEHGNFATEYGSDHRCLVKLGCKGPGRQVQRAAARLGQRHRRLPQRRRHLHGLHDARLPRQVHAVHGRGRPGQGLRERGAVHLRPDVALGPRRSRSSGPAITSRSGASADRSSPPATRSAGSGRPREFLTKRGPGGYHSDPRGSEDHRQGDVVGSDHPDRRQPRHPHGDRLHEPAGAQVLQHLDGVPRLRHLHEGHRPARCPLHHEPHLWHLR